MLSEENKAHLRNCPTGVAINCDKITFRFDELEWLMNAVRQEEREQVRSVLEEAEKALTHHYDQDVPFPERQELTRKALGRIRQAKDASP